MSVRAVLVPLLFLGLASSAGAQRTARARELGIVPGTLAPGPLNAITDVAGVRVGQTTVSVGDSVRTGVTAILPHGGNAFLDRVPAAIHVGNGFGKLLGVTQVAELGELETPILLTCTLCVWKAADAMVAWLLAQPGMADVRSINPVVGETNDGTAQRHPRADRSASATCARRSTSRDGRTGGGGERGRGHRDGRVRLEGRDRHVVAPCRGGGQHLDRRACWCRPTSAATCSCSGVRSDARSAARASTSPGRRRGRSGSIMIVVATDAPLSDRNLQRLAARAIIGLARTGSAMGNGSGDYVIAFSTHPGVRRKYGAARLATTEVGNDEMTGLFQAVVDATEEAIYNSLFTATTVTAKTGTVEAIPVAEVVRILDGHGMLTK